MEEADNHEHAEHLLISDEYFFYDVVDVNPNLPYKKIKKIIYNQLLLLYPADFIKDFYLFNTGERFIVLIPNERFFNMMEKHKHLLQKAKYVSTPKLENLQEDTDNPLDKENDADIANIDKIKHPIIITKRYKEFAFLIAPAIVIAVAYIIFLTANIVELKPLKAKLNNLNLQLQSIYTKAGVANSEDPYGLLLYKVSQSNMSTSTRVITLLDEISKALGNQGKLKDFKFSNNSALFDGACKSFGDLETIKNRLAKLTKGQVEILSSNLKNNRVSFTIKVNL